MKIFLALFGLLLSLLGNGCSTVASMAGFGHAGQATDSASANVYRTHVRLPSHVRRVAVLPLAANSSEVDADAGREALEPVLHSELAKCRKFELVIVSEKHLQQWTGRPRWTAEEPLPADLLSKLRKEFDCDAILFSRLSRYRAYAPLQIGWNIKLVNSDEPGIWWSVDEFYDAGEPGVARSAQKYYEKYLLKRGPGADPSSVLVSPRQFGEYALNAALATLPTR